MTSAVPAIDMTFISGATLDVLEGTVISARLATATDTDMASTQGDPSTSSSGVTSIATTMHDTWFELSDGRRVNFSVDEERAPIHEGQEVALIVMKRGDKTDLQSMYIKDTQTWRDLKRPTEMLPFGTLIMQGGAAITVIAVVMIYGGYFEYAMVPLSGWLYAPYYFRKKGQYVADLENAKKAYQEHSAA